MTTRYDPRARRYRDDATGRFMTQARVRELTEQSIRATQSPVTLLAELVANGQLSPADWHEAMRREIKLEVIRQAIAGAGGRDQMTPQMWGMTGGVVSDQYRHLDRKLNNFYEQVQSGELTEGTIAARARMYINSAREGYERALGRRLSGSEYDEEHWFTTANESCPNCVDLQQMGWVAIGSLPTAPGAGATACLTNCKCHVSYRSSRSGLVFGESETQRMTMPAASLQETRTI